MSTWQARPSGHHQSTVGTLTPYDHTGPQAWGQSIPVCKEVFVGVVRCWTDQVGSGAVVRVVVLWDASTLLLSLHNTV